jgi:hypothetical protein
MPELPEPPGGTHIKTFYRLPVSQVWLGCREEGYLMVRMEMDVYLDKTIDEKKILRLEFPRVDNIDPEGVLDYDHGKLNIMESLKVHPANDLFSIVDKKGYYLDSAKNGVDVVDLVVNDSSDEGLKKALGALSDCIEKYREQTDEFNEKNFTGYDPKEEKRDNPLGSVFLPSKRRLVENAKKQQAPFDDDTLKRMAHKEIHHNVENERLTARVTRGIGQQR